jgi:hypothetical protein
MISTLKLAKGREIYLLRYDHDNAPEALRKIGQMASNPELSFNWYDAALWSQTIRQIGKLREERRIA